ncbi:hypothetical protein [Delftia acidovorans]
MTTAPTPDLLPCPFCGGPASAHEVNPKEAPGWVRLTVAHTPDCFSRAPKETLLLSAADLERWNRRAELEARKPLPLSDAEIIAAQEALALSRSRIGLPCTRCGNGKYRADCNAYHDFHRCDACMHVPMWDADGNELGATGPLPCITG